MAKFTEIEMKIIEKYIKDGTLRTSLGLIRESVEELWGDDTPRIIKKFTDHGIRHCERLVGYANKLLEANDGKDLDEYEAYLLLAGIYLHDIGMQCDVVKFPKIKEQAEKLGAEFNINFTASTEEDYSIKEQNSIRQNHQYLSAAWISYACHTGKTTLGSALKKVPPNLILDLMDVCKCHSKLPITSCSSGFTLYPEMRKKLVATLLRFSDELDIDGNRVSLETVKNFSFNPHNKLYWWLHNLTTVNFISKNLVILKIALHPEDMKKYGSIIQEEYIENFKSKNQVILDILARENILIRIDSNSKVEEYEFSEELPIEITSILDNMKKRDDPLLSLANEVRMWLQIIKYEVTEFGSFDERTVNIKAVSPFKQNVLIRCIGGEIGEKDVCNLDKLLDRKTPQGWLVSDKRVSQKARLLASEDSTLEVFNLKEFLRQKVWGQYFDTLRSLVEKERIHEMYVDIGCYKESVEDEKEIRDEYSSLDDYIDDWLTERGKTHISLLGEFGTGKTWFCRHYAYTQLDRFLKDPVKQRIPLLITLRDFIKATTVQQLINDALLEQYKLPFVGSAYNAFKEMNRQGKLLLILDGFDEMARQVDYQTVVDNFWELAELIDDNSKVILTSRTEYFRWAKESEKILTGKEYGRNTIVLAPPKFEVLYLKHFNDDQIRDVIVKQKGNEQGSIVADKILGQENLAEMARKPLLIELLLAALDEVNEDILENQSQVYLYATNKLLLRNIETKRTFTTTSDKLYFLCELAWEMIKTGNLSINYLSIPERIKTYFGESIKDQHELDNWDFDLRNQTLLHRNSAGYYQFAHKSLAEYFVALKFALDLDILDEVFSKTYFGSDQNKCLITFKAKNINELADIFGLIPFTSEQMKAIYEFLCEMLSNDYSEKLINLICSTRDKNFEIINYTGGNAISLLQNNRKTFTGIDLSNTVLKGAILQYCDFTSSNLEKINLQKCKIKNCSFENSSLINSDLSFSSLRSCNMDGVNIQCSNLSGSSFYNCSMVKSKMNDCNLTNSLLKSCSLICTNMKNTRLQGIQIEDPEINDFSWFNDGKCIVAYVSDGSIRIWNILTGQLVHSFQPKIKYSEFDMSISKINHTDLLALTSFGSDIILLFDVKKGTSLNCSMPVEMTNRLYSSQSGRYISSSHGGTGLLKIWDSLSGVELSSFEAQPGWCNAAYPLNNEELVLSTGYGGEIRTWNWEKKELVSSFVLENAKNIFNLQMTANQDIIGATVDFGDFSEKYEDRVLKILILTYPNFEPIFSIDVESDERRFILSPDGSYIVTIYTNYSDIVEDKDFSSKLSLHSLKNDKQITLIENNVNIQDLKFNFDGRFLAFTYGSKIQILEIDKEELKIKQYISNLIAKTNCQDMEINETSELYQEIECSEQDKNKKQILLQFLLDRGARIEQQATVKPI